MDRQPWTNVLRSVMAVASVVLVSLAATSAPASADYPIKPVRIVVPYAPGGATDLVARVLGEQMKKILGQAFVIENKPGAFGILAIEEMTRGKADGYTLMIGNVTTNAMTPVLFPKKFSIDYGREVVAVSNLVDIPAFFLVTAKDFPPNTVAEFVAHARRHGGKLRYASAGVGSYPHFDMALFAKRANLDMVHIPNKAGGTGMLKDMATGDAHASFVSVATSLPLIKAGLIRAIAVVNPTRLPEYPDLPTMAEVGYPDIGTLAWQGMFAPAGTPRPVLETLHKAVLRAMDTDTVKEAFQKQYFNLVPNKSVADAGAWLAAELSHWKKISDDAKIDLED
jgi:tripartite-type tricarboxylate transporter receptor subunit TctC